jgi:hypothetical protein
MYRRISPDRPVCWMGARITRMDTDSRGASFGDKCRALQRDSKMGDSCIAAFPPSRPLCCIGARITRMDTDSRGAFFVDKCRVLQRDSKMGDSCIAA